jgi:cell division protein ZapB
MNGNFSQNNTEEPGKGKGQNRTVWIVVVVLALLVIAAGVFIFIRENNLKQTNAALMTAYAQLDSIGTELDGKIDEIEDLGGEVADLILVRDSLEQEKEALRESQIRSQKEIRRLGARVEGYRELLVMKDKEIEELKTINQELLTENVELKTEKNALTQTLQAARQTQEKLSEKVAIASRLEAEDIHVVAINSRGGEKEDEFRSRQVEKLKVDFRIARNDVAPVEGKEIMMRIIDGNGNVLFDVARGSGTFVLDGKETFYTAKQEILFDNTQQRVTYIYDKGSEYLPGRYEMQIYTDGYMMGSKPFVVK